MNLEALLWNVLQISLTVSLVALLLLALRRPLGKRYPARSMCLIWVLLAFRLLIPVQLAPVDAPVAVTPHINQVVYTSDAVVADHTAASADLTHAWVSSADAAELRANGSAATVLPLESILATVWLAGALLFITWQLGGYAIYRRRLRRTAVAVEDEELLTALADCRAELGLRRSLPLFSSPLARCPMLIGLCRPAVYLTTDQLSSREAAFIFRHELNHLRHGDLWVKLLLVAARAVHWFNPIVHLLARSANRDLELACDAAVAAGLDTAERHAYGRIILDSAADRMRGQALVSCFADDKQTLLSRFEQIFDRGKKRRGLLPVAFMLMLVLLLGACVSVGTDTSDRLTAEEITSLGEAWMSGGYRDAEPWYKLLASEQAQQFYDQQAAYGEEIAKSTGVDPSEAMWLIGSSSPSVRDFAVIPDVENQQAVIVTEWELLGSLPSREAELIHFTWEAGEWKVDRVEGNAYINDTPFHAAVDSLAQFELIYGNDLGLPDIPALIYADDGSLEPLLSRDGETVDWEDPIQAAVAALGLVGGEPSTLRQHPGEAELVDETAEISYLSYRFADGSEVILTLFGSYSVQDWTTAELANNRTANDLAQQFGRAVIHKNARYLYPILSAELLPQFIEYQLDVNGGEVWSWKLGGSSPSFREYVTLPTDDPSCIRVVFNAFGGGLSDYRFAYEVTTIREDGRTVIDTIRLIDSSELTQAALFELYYGSGLSLPTALSDDPEDFYNAGTHADLQEPSSALSTMIMLNEGTIDPMAELDYAPFSGTIEQVNAAAEGHLPILRLTFDDGSGSVDISMAQQDGWWQPDEILSPSEEVGDAAAK